LTYILLSVLFVFLGAYSIAGQIYFIRELLVVFFGNELCLGLIFAGWFAAIGVGAATGTRFGNKTNPSARAFLICVAIFSLLPCLNIFLIRMVRTLFDIVPGGNPSIVHIAVGIFISICPFSFIIGFIFPLSCRVLIGSDGKGSREIGWVYVCESIGSLMGGIIISFFLIPHFSALHVFSFGALFVFAVSFLLARRLRFTFGKVLFFVLLIGDVIAFSTGAFGTLEKYFEKVRWDSFNNSLMLVESRDSRYQNIVLAKAEEQYSLFTNGAFITTYPDKYQSAVKAHFLLSQHPNPRRILLIGGGITGLLYEILKHPVERVDYIELDHECTDIILPVLSEEDMSAVNDVRVRVVHMDGRRYVKETLSTYDLIIVDTPDPSTAQLNRFYTVDFFREIKKILSEHGMLIVGMSSTANYISRETADYNSSLYCGLTKVFPIVMAVPGERNYFFAGKHENLFSLDHNVIGERYKDRGIRSAHFAPGIFEWLLQEERITLFSRSLLDNDGGMINTDFHPVTFFYNLIIWGEVSGLHNVLSIFHNIQERGVWLFLSPLFFFFIAGSIFLCVKREQKFIDLSCFWIIGTTGYAAIALEIVIIFTFQCFYGYIYEKIGIIIALFMMGLAGGGALIRNRLKHQQKNRFYQLTALETSICFFSISLPFLLHAIADIPYSTGQFFVTEYFFFVLVVIIGFLVGMEFPLICHLLICRGYEGGRAAGWVDSMDHIGACFGALFTGVLFLPVFGTYATCFIIAFLKLTCIVFLLLTGTYRKTVE